MSSGSSSSFSSENVIPVSEGRCIIANKVLVVVIMMVGTGPNGEEMVKRPREFVTGVGINSLKKT